MDARDSFGRTLRARRLRRLLTKGRAMADVAAMYGLTTEQVEEELAWLRKRQGGKQSRAVSSSGVAAVVGSPPG